MNGGPYRSADGTKMRSVSHVTQLTVYGAGLLRMES